MEDFTLDFVQTTSASGDNGSIIIKQILFLANAKHLLRDIPIQVLRAANQVAWPKEKQFFVNLSPVRRQIKSRLAKSYKIVQECIAAQDLETQAAKDDDASKTGASETEA